MRKVQTQISFKPKSAEKKENKSPIKAQTKLDCDSNLLKLTASNLNQTSGNILELMKKQLREIDQFFVNMPVSHELTSDGEDTIHEEPSFLKKTNLPFPDKILEIDEELYPYVEEVNKMRLKRIVPKTQTSQKKRKRDERAEKGVKQVKLSSPLQ